MYQFYIIPLIIAKNDPHSATYIMEPKKKVYEHIAFFNDHNVDEKRHGF